MDALIPLAMQVVQIAGRENIPWVVALMIGFGGAAELLRRNREIVAENRQLLRERSDAMVRIARLEAELSHLREGKKRGS